MHHWEQRRIEKVKSPIFTNNFILPVWVGSECTSDALSNLPPETDVTHFVPSPYITKKLIHSSLDSHEIFLLIAKLNTELFSCHSANIYLSKVNNRNAGKRCEISSNSTIKTLEHHWRRSCVFIANFTHISHLFLKFLLLTLK